ncbi:MAG: TetR/AcrR family transcriptional regulator [Rhodobacterales bacterium]|nr:MAG: TetR/AcrR family transcriptional regulator [Rhodobacterales bacterium]
MDKMTQRLSREDWVLAGFRALAAKGVGGLRVEPVARDLGATKGSFYWHFADPAAWRDAMLEYWQDKAYRSIVVLASEAPPGMARLARLVAIASAEGRDPAYGGVEGEPALRAWARHDPIVAGVLRGVDAGRVGFLHDCFCEVGLPDARAVEAAKLFYAGYIGLQELNTSEAEMRSSLEGLLVSLCAAAAGK